jgi:iron complex transport system ATP-binding protein
VNGPGRSMVEARSLHFSYSAARPVICEASLTLARGSMSALIGPNGCGKSTLVRLLARVLRPGSGTILFDGAALSSIDPRALAKKLAYVPQATPRIFPFTALEVVLTGRSPYVPRLRFETPQDNAKAMHALETVGIAQLALRRVTELSAGERQLVSVARALAQEPACLLLDEPSSSLDLKHRAGLIRTLSEMRSRTGLTVLMVTHDLSQLDPGFDMLFAMRAGTVAVQGSPREVLCNSVLADVYGDHHIRARRVDGRSVVWSEASE